MDKICKLNITMTAGGESYPCESVNFSAKRAGKTERVFTRSPFTPNDCDYNLILEMQAQG